MATWHIPKYDKIWQYVSFGEKKLNVFHLFDTSDPKYKPRSNYVLTAVGAGGGGGAYEGLSVVEEERWKKDTNISSYLCLASHRNSCQLKHLFSIW